jgi:hypothetical protein
MDINQIYGVATFYKSFSLVPKGKHSITLCLGTACHVRGGPKILRELKNLLHVEPGQTTADKPRPSSQPVQAEDMPQAPQSRDFSAWRISEDSRTVITKR